MLITADKWKCNNIAMARAIQIARLVPPAWYSKKLDASPGRMCPANTVCEKNDSSDSGIIAIRANKCRVLCLRYCALRKCRRRYQ